MELIFRALEESAPGPLWQTHARLHWPAYRHWYFANRPDERPALEEGFAALRRFMPELVPLYGRLQGLLGDGATETDAAETARFLTLWNPPAYLTGCSQAIYRGPRNLLARNYDYSPRLCEGLLLLSRWNGRAVLASVDCLWGALDGINESGLAVSLTFGGRPVVGRQGFGVPLLLRYILEFCATASEAAEACRRVPIHMAYNITALDKSGAFFTALLAPDREPNITRLPIAANHQTHIDWHRYAEATATLERERFLFMKLRDPHLTEAGFLGGFLARPLYTTAYEKSFGTLYTAAFWPESLEASYFWREEAMRLSLAEFQPQERRILYRAIGP